MRRPRPGPEPWARAAGSDTSKKSRRGTSPGISAPRTCSCRPRISGTNTPLKIYSFLKSGKPFVATRLYTHTQVLTDEMVILADPTPGGMAEGLDFALGSEEARRRARDSKLRADAEYIYPNYLEKIALALSKAVGRA